MRLLPSLAIAGPLWLTASLATATVAETLCHAAPERVVEAAKGAPVLVMRSAGTTDLFRLEAIADTLSADPRGFAGARRVRVEMDDIQRVCAAGYDVSVIDISPPRRRGDEQKGYVQPATLLPSSFTIVGLWGEVWGNLWAPQSLPLGHTYQVADFKVTPYNYAASGAFAHLVVPVLTTSNSDFQSDFDGKGAIFFGNSGACSAVIEAWAIQNWSEATGCGTGPTCQAVVYSPDSCSSWDSSQPRRFLVGANVWQSVTYWSCPTTGACPAFASPTIDTWMSGYRIGGAGVGFFVAMASSSTVWSLSPSDVVAYTGQ